MVFDSDAIVEKTVKKKCNKRNHQSPSVAHVTQAATIKSETAPPTPSFASPEPPRELGRGRRRNISSPIEG